MDLTDVVTSGLGLVFFLFYELWITHSSFILFSNYNNIKYYYKHIKHVYSITYISIVSIVLQSDTCLLFTHIDTLGGLL